MEKFIVLVLTHKLNIQGVHYTLVRFFLPIFNILCQQFSYSIRLADKHSYRHLEVRGEGLVIISCF